MAWSAERKAYPTFGKIERKDPRFDQLIPQDAKLEKLAEGFDWAEGAVWDKKNQCLFFSDIPPNSVMKWKEGEGITLFLKPSGYTGSKPRGGEPGSNGLHFDWQGRLILCQHGDRRIARLKPETNRSRHWPTSTTANASTAPTTPCSNPTAICISPIRPTDWKD